MEDELNVVPETFQPAAEAQKNQLVRTGIPLQPPERIEGRFAAAERLPGGWYQQGNDSMGNLAAGAMLSNRPGLNPNMSRDSFDSNMSVQNSIYMPRRVESIMGEEDRKKYALAQASQREAGGAYFTGPSQDQVCEMTETELQKEGWRESVEAFKPYHDRSNQRANSYDSNASLEISPDTSPVEPTSTSGALTFPHVAGGRNGRNGRSPLGRVSLVRTASRDASNTELEDQQRQSQGIGQWPEDPDPSRRRS
jgi:chitin synthase